MNPRLLATAALSILLFSNIYHTVECQSIFDSQVSEVANSIFTARGNATRKSVWDLPGSDIKAKDLVKGSKDYLALFKEETEWYNNIVLFFIPTELRNALPHTVESWIRNYVAGVLVYFLTGGLWSLYVYKMRGSYFYAPGTMPTNEAIIKQITVSMKSMPLYVSLPTVSEFMVENGWTKCFSQVDELGTSKFIAYFVIYMIFVEFGIYWMHRGLHDIKPLYKWLHATHHIYNKQNTLSPFASKLS